MILKWSFLVVLVYLSSLEAAFVDTLKKCHTEDEKCLIDLIQNIFKDISAKGIEEINIPPIDPFELKDINVSILNVINITMVEGTISGLKDCVINRAEVHLKDKKGIFDVTCDVVIKGKHKVIGSNEIFQNLFGGNSVHGEGNFQLDLKKLHMTLNYYYTIVKKEDGEVYLKANREDFHYSYDVGGLHIDADNIFLGENDASKIMVEYMNQNWKSVIEMIGGAFFDVALKDMLYDIVSRFFDNIAPKYYLIDDLSSFARK